MHWNIFLQNNASTYLYSLDSVQFAFSLEVVYGV